MADEEIKYLAVGEFIDLGYLQEINRLVLHPAGLALEVTPTEEGGPTRFAARVWDYRDDPEGMVYGPGMMDADKRENVRVEMAKHAPARRMLLGSEDASDPDHSYPGRVQHINEEVSGG